MRGALGSELGSKSANWVALPATPLLLLLLLRALASVLLVSILVLPPNSCAA